MNSRKITRPTYRRNRNGFLSNNKLSSTGFPKRFNNIKRTRRPIRRLFPKIRRNRLQRVQNALGYNRKFRNPQKKNNFNPLSYKTNQNNYNNNNKREVFVKGLPRFVDNKILFNLFRNEGRINQCNVLYDNIGFSRGIGKIEFADFRDAWKAINKWNNSNYKGFTLKLEYKKTINGQKAGNTIGNSMKYNNNRNYGGSSNYGKINGYSRNYNGNRYNYNNYGYSRYKY